LFLFSVSSGATLLILPWRPWRPLRENIILQSTHCVFHAKDATIAKRGSTSPSFFQDHFSGTCIKKGLFLFSVSSGATL
jgi:hypothetical protein